MSAGASTARIPYTEDPGDWLDAQEVAASEIASRAMEIAAELSDLSREYRDRVRDLCGVEEEGCDHIEAAIRSLEEGYKTLAERQQKGA